MEPPTYADVLAARPRVYAHLQPSPLLHHPLLDEWVGCRVLVKHENHNPTGSFKIRGGLNLVAQLDDRERGRGVVAASTGNHGQSLALACQPKSSSRVATCILSPGSRRMPLKSSRLSSVSTSCSFPSVAEAAPPAAPSFAKVWARRRASSVFRRRRPMRLRARGAGPNG